MKGLTLAGHPVHPQLIAGPLGLLPFSFAMDIGYHTTGRRPYANAAYFALTGGLATGAAAATTGLLDYFTIPAGSRSKRTANTHLLLNVGSMTAFATSYALRRPHRKPSPAATALTAIGTLGLIAAGWYGGHLVYHLGMRVRESEKEKQPAIPGDRTVERGFHRMEEPVPAAGPESQPER